MVGVQIGEETKGLARVALDLSFSDPKGYESRKSDDVHAIEKLRSSLQVGTIIYRPSYQVDYYEIYEVKPDDQDSWIGRWVYGQNVLYSARPVHSTALGNVREYWGADLGITFWLSDVAKEYDNYDGIPRDFVIAAKSFTEVEAHVSQTFPQTDLRDTLTCAYLRKIGGWR